MDAILAEHVWKHLDCNAAIVAAQNCFTYLKPGGYIRVAVPDGLHPDDSYIDYVKPGGWGADSDDHHVLYTYSTLQTVFASVGFQIRLLEYFDERGRFHDQERAPADGMIAICTIRQQKPYWRTGMHLDYSGCQKSQPKIEWLGALASGSDLSVSVRPQGEPSARLRRTVEQ